MKLKKRTVDKVTKRIAHPVIKTRRIRKRSFTKLKKKPHTHTTTTRKIPEKPGAFSTSEDNVANN